jgi:hypothetical protein
MHGRYRVLAETKDGKTEIIAHGILYEHTAMMIAATRTATGKYKRVYVDKWPV